MVMILGHLFSYGTKRTPMRLLERIVPLAAGCGPSWEPQRQSWAGTESWEAHTVSTMGKRHLMGELRLLWLWMHANIHRAWLGWQEWLLGHKRLMEQSSC